MPLPTDAMEPGASQRWEHVPVEQVADGIGRQMIIGQQLMVCRLTFRPHLDTAVHSHPHEQITMVEKGRVRFSIGGATRIVGPGEILHFPPGVPHGATMLEEEVVLIDIFTPVREDFLARDR